MRYDLDQLGSDSFEHLIQSLVRGIAGNSVAVFGDGPDGQREAVIEESKEYSINDTVTTHGRTIIQAKYKSPNTKTEDWPWLRNNLKDELEGFRGKALTHPDAVPETLLFFTNIVLTPVLNNGIHDKAEAFISQYKDIIPQIYVFGADDIQVMLENNRDVATCYAGFIMSGDILMELHQDMKEIKSGVSNSAIVFNQKAEKIVNIESVENLYI